MKKKLIALLTLTLIAVCAFTLTACGGGNNSNNNNGDDYHEHEFTTYVFNNDGTCTENGTETANCDVDGCTETDTRTKETIGIHSYTTYEYNNDATCTANGTETAYCDYGCGASDTRTKLDSALTHSFTQYVTDGNATYEADGTKTAFCDHGCGETDTVADEGSILAPAVDVFTFEGNTITGLTELGKTQTQLVVPETIGDYTITKVADLAFANNENLVSVKFPNTVTNIGKFMFGNCTNLKYVTLPDYLDTVGDTMFYNNPKLEGNVQGGVIYIGSENNPYLFIFRAETTEVVSVQIDIGCRFIGNEAFSGCKKLESVQVPGALTTILANAFSYCDKLTSINFPSTVSTIHYGAFNGTGLTSFETPSLVTELSNSVIASTDVKTIIIHNNVTKIYKNTLWYCYELEKIIYRGTKAEWNAISKDGGWDWEIYGVTVECTDGDLFIE